MRPGFTGYDVRADRRQRRGSRGAPVLFVFKSQCPNLMVAVSAPFLICAPVLLLLCSTLAACSPPVELPLMKAYVTPSMPTMDAAAKGITQAATEEKITGPIETSDLRQTDHGPGRFVLCIRAVEAKYSRPVTYAVFFDNNDYKGSRMSVMIDDCERQDYRPFP
jgi:hypothetical protein